MWIRDYASLHSFDTSCRVEPGCREVICKKKAVYERVGLLFLQGNKVMQPAPDRLQDYQTHAGQRRGQWPTSPEISAAMFERYNCYNKKPNGSDPKP